jgi:hypothetical protein
MTSKVLAAVGAIALFLFAVPTFAGPTALREIPASGITIDKATLVELQQTATAGICVAFTNVNSVAAKRVEFLYALISKEGKVLYGTVHEAKGVFAPGAAIQGTNPVLCETMYAVSYRGSTVGVSGGEGSLVVSVSQVDFADGSWWHAGPDVAGAVLPQPDSAVRLVRSFSWEPGESTQECASIENRGAGTLLHVRVMFSHIADDGSDVVDDPFDVYPALAPGATRTACRGWNGSLSLRVGTAPNAQPPQIVVFGKASRLVAWISQVSFESNPSWSATAPDLKALSASVVPSTIDYSHAVWWSDQLQVPETIRQQLDSGIEISKSYAWAPGDVRECADLVSHSPKPVKRVRLMFSHLAHDGSAIAPDDPLDISASRGSTEVGATPQSGCRDFDGYVVLPSFWQDGSTTATVLFQGQPSTIDVHVDEVDYADGTVWHSTIVPF